MDLKDYNSVQAEILNNLYADHKAKNNNVANVEFPFGEKTVMGVIL